MTVPTALQAYKKISLNMYTGSALLSNYLLKNSYYIELMIDRGCQTVACWGRSLFIMYMYPQVFSFVSFLFLLFFSLDCCHS
jgi:hypothetical protein